MIVIKFVFQIVLQFLRSFFCQYLVLNLASLPKKILKNEFLYFRYLNYHFRLFMFMIIKNDLIKVFVLKKCFTLISNNFKKYFIYLI
jgi:hypothetical protein